MDTGVTENRPGARAIRLQILVMMLSALLPVAWLIGRRTAPAVVREPVIFGAGEAPITLQESARGLAANDTPVGLPALPGGAGAYRLLFVPGGSGGAGQPPYRLRIEAPDGSDIWQSIWSAPGADRAAAELVLPASRLQHGKHALLVEDAAGTMRSFPFLVP
jgi:hypothetical protein